MKTSMERVQPIALDIESQSIKDDSKDRPYVFFYEDGGIFRAFLCSSVSVETEGGTVTAKGSDGLPLVVVPSDTTWRLVHKNLLEFVPGSIMEQVEAVGLKQKQEIRKKIYKKLGYDIEDEDKSKEKKEKRAKDKLPMPGQYV